MGVYSCDFETTVYKNQKSTCVWAAAYMEVDNDDNCGVFNSLGDFLFYFFELPGNHTLYFHNLKFDGEFILHYLFTRLDFTLAFENDAFLDDRKMKNNSFKTVISSTGLWYKITIKVNNKLINIRDSLKLLPFSVKKLGKDFKTKHQKTEIEYIGYREEYGKIEELEKEYIINDVGVVSEALQIMKDEGHTRLTIGACCLAEYKKIIGYSDYSAIFPDLDGMEIDNKFGTDTAADYIRKAYRGGWTYLKKGCENKKIYNGFTLDVNSLYPSVMHSESGNKYPVGKPTFWKGDYIPMAAVRRYFYVRLQCRFKIKPGFLPFIQIKNSYLYKANTMLETSDIEYKGKYYDSYTCDGVDVPAIVTLTLTCTDLELFLDHYNVTELKILDGCYFNTSVGLFDKYIDKYKRIKQRSTGAQRQISKLFLNNLYGKLCTSPQNDFKIPFIRSDRAVGFSLYNGENKKGGYIAAGAAVTSYARAFTIRAAQKNYSRFIYADTDSIHCVGDVSDVVGVKIHDSDFLCWKCENTWDVGWFVRQKTYYEKSENDVVLKCAGMPDRCKDLFLQSIGDKKGITPNDVAESVFLSEQRDITDFTYGLQIPSKLVPKHIDGGVILVSTTFELLP